MRAPPPVTAVALIAAFTCACASGEAPAEETTPDAGMEPSPEPNAEDGGGAHEGDGAPSSPPVAQYGLVAIRENAQAAAGSVTANAGFVTVYALSVGARAEDVLRVYGQI